MNEISAQGYVVKNDAQPIKRYCQTLDLKEDSALIEEYKYWHEAKNIWPEIPAGLKAIGVINMEIYRLDARLFMIVDTPINFDWDKAFAQLAQMNKQAEWEQFVDKYQAVQQGAASSEKWRLMERIFNLAATSS